MRVSNFKELFMSVAKSLLPIFAVSILLFVVSGVELDLFFNFLFGFVLVFIGLLLFLHGVRVGLLPMGEAVGSRIFQHNSLVTIFLLVFVIGFSVTLAEPDLSVLAGQIEQISEGSIDRLWVILTVSLGVGISMSLGLISFLVDWPLKWLFFFGYLVTFALFFLTPPSFLAISFDAGGVTTGPVTVPFLLALGIGLGTVLETEPSEGHGLGLVGLASIGPIITLMILGILLF